MWVANDPHVICGCTDQCWVAQSWECETSTLPTIENSLNQCIFLMIGAITSPCQYGKYYMEENFLFVFKFSLCYLLAVWLEQVNQILWILVCSSLVYGWKNILVLLKKKKAITHYALPSTYLGTQFMLISLFESFNNTSCKPVMYRKIINWLDAGWYGNLIKKNMEVSILLFAYLQLPRSEEIWERELEFNGFHGKLAW